MLSVKGRDSMGYDGKLTFDTKIDESGFNSGVNRLGTLAKSGMAVLAGYVTSFTVLTKGAVDEVAQLEQNIGGVETLFEKSADAIINKANGAYKTAGLSANEYMSTITSFSASLLQSLENDTEKAAEYADRAIVDMSDNANKMGTNMEMIQNAYQGFAKQNYTMLDNLKLGYGGTKTEMERLIKDASQMKDIQEQLGITVDESSLSFGNIVNAISVMQEKMGIAGTTAKEAATTIEGSMNSAKAAWNNFLAGTASPEELAEAIGIAADVMVDNLEEIVPRLAETVPEVVERLAPTMLDAGKTLAKAGLSIMEDFVGGVIEAAPQLPEKGAEILSQLISGIQENAPSMLTTATDIFAGFVEGIASQLPTLIPQALQMVVVLADAVISNMPTIINAGISLLKGLVLGIINSLPTLIAEGPRIINDFADAIYSGLWELIKAGGEMLLSLLKGIWDNVPLMLENAGEIFMAFINIFSLSNLYNLGKNLIKNLINGVKQLGPNILDTGESIVELLVNGIKKLATHPVTALKDIASNIMKTVKGLDWKSIGSHIVNGMVQGLKNGITKVASIAKDVAGAALSAAKKALGIKSPSRRFRDEVGKNMALGIGVGFDKNIPVDDMTGTLSDSVQRMKKKVSSVTQDVGADNASRISKVYISGNSTERDPEDVTVIVENYFEVDGEKLVDKTTKATIKKINGMQVDANKSKGK